MHCPSSPFRNPGLHLQVKPTGEETLGAKRHNWSHFVFSQGLFAWGCSAIWLASTDRGCETRWDTTVSFLPLYFLKREKTQNIFLFLHVQLTYNMQEVCTFIFEKLIKKKRQKLYIIVLLFIQSHFKFTASKFQFRPRNKMRQDNFSFAVIFPKKRQNYLVLSVDILCIKALKTRFCDIKKYENFFWPLCF